MMKGRDMRRNFSQTFAVSLALLALCSLCFYGCGKGNGTGSAPGAASSPKPQTAFERDLDYVRKSQFTYVFVFSRTDGGAFTKDDIAYLKANSPPETNQWLSTDEGKRVIAGTHFEFKPEHFDALRKRFNIEDYTGK